MERLTDKDINKVGFDAWELCGLGYECKRDCQKPVPCKIPKIICRLAELEDEIENGTLMELPKLKYAITVDMMSSNKHPNYLIEEHVPYAEHWGGKWHIGYKPIEWRNKIIAEYDTREEAEKRLEELKNAERKKV